MTDLQSKILNAFSGKVVRKDLAFLVKGGLPVPTYVLEYLLGQYCASDDEQVIADGLEKVKQIIKENYVFRYMALSVNYLERQDEFRHSLLQTVKEDGLPAVRQRLSSPTESYQAFKEFYRIFDETILGIYPDFVRRVNSLLKEDCQIPEPKGKTLTTELRILAAIRIGITDSGRIATFLKCSPATVYTYRTKMRNWAAFTKEEFEERIKKI